MDHVFKDNSSESERARRSAIEAELVERELLGGNPGANPGTV